jgi:TP901 family phage tail tape measure protein
MSTKRRIEYELGLSVDSAGIDALKRELATLRIDIQNKKELGEATEELNRAYRAADRLEDILNKSWNSKLGQLDLSAVRREIQTTYKGVDNLKNNLEQGGKLGTTAFNSFAKAVLNTNVYIKQSSSLLDEMATSMKNTIKWGITSSLFNNLTGSLQKAWSYSVDLNSSLTDIRLVTNNSADEMERFAKNANNAAKALGASTKDYTKAALIYYQQGDSDEIARAKAEVTLKTANVTGQSGQEVSEQLTSVWNGYKVSADEAELYIDKLAAVAAATASDLEELSTGMSKVASAANLMGVDVDQLNATLATVVSVTRQAPESVGTAFKTIYARMGDIEAGLDAETTLGSYTEKIKEISGISVLDTNGKLRDMGKVIEEVGSKWGDLSREQQIALSQVMAGTRQYNNLLALFDN